jgi:hypothetical protein
MSTTDQRLYSALHGTAMGYAAERRNLDESIEELRKIADSRNDILAEAAGITAGSWYASPATHVATRCFGSPTSCGGLLSLSVWAPRGHQAASGFRRDQPTWKKRAVTM